MKSDLILRKFTTTPVIGTQCIKELRNFFGSKMLEIEDSITVDNISIQWSDITDSSPADVINYGVGYQFFQYTHRETISLASLDTLKKDNHTIVLDHQSQADLEFNTRWILTIDMFTILRQYLYYRIKESRAFKCVTKNDLFLKNINLSIYDYVDKNVMNRYKFKNIEFYVKYIDISDKQTILLSDPLLKYNPKYDYNVMNSGELVTTLNITGADQIKNLTVNYSQTKKSSQYKFDYYFNLIFEKI